MYIDWAVNRVKTEAVSGPSLDLEGRLFSYLKYLYSDFFHLYICNIGYIFSL